jgi:hypothetical protein
MLFSAARRISCANSSEPGQMFAGRHERTFTVAPAVSALGRKADNVIGSRRTASDCRGRKHLQPQAAFGFQRDPLNRLVMSIFIDREPAALQ